MAAEHSTFTPGQLSPATLEALFVVREPLVRGIMDGIRASAASGNKHQRLLIGPRGSGKSHLVALVYHRVRADRELAARLRIWSGSFRGGARRGRVCHRAGPERRRMLAAQGPVSGGSGPTRRGPAGVLGAGEPDRSG
jgi:hypothetical protein